MTRKHAQTVSPSQLLAFATRIRNWLRLQPDLTIGTLVRVTGAPRPLCTRVRREWRKVNP